MATKVSKQILEEIPEHLTLREEALNIRKKKLDLIESDLKELSDKIEADRLHLSEKEKELHNLLNITKNSDKFNSFYSHIDKLYSLFVSSRGNSEGLIDTIKLIIDARDNFVPSVKNKKWYIFFLQ